MRFTLSTGILLRPLFYCFKVLIVIKSFSSDGAKFQILGPNENQNQSSKSKFRIGDKFPDSL